MVLFFFAISKVRLRHIAPTSDDNASTLVVDGIIGQQQAVAVGDSTGWRIKRCGHFVYQIFGYGCEKNDV
jgi:transketolase N-terminal domain/subunit